MKEEKQGIDRRKLRRVILVVLIILLFVCTMIALIVFSDFSKNHVIVRLGNYKHLTVNSGSSEPEDAIVDAVVKKTWFGKALKTKVEEKTEESIDYFKQQAEFYGMDYAEYLDRFYAMSETEFRKHVEEVSDTEVRRSSVLHAIADEEGIELTDDDMIKLKPEILKAYSYADWDTLVKEVDLTSLMDELLMERVILYLLEQNTVK